jgi:hypothetical protein
VSAAGIECVLVTSPAAASRIRARKCPRIARGDRHQQEISKWHEIDTGAVVRASSRNPAAVSPVHPARRTMGRSGNRRRCSLAGGWRMRLPLSRRTAVGRFATECVDDPRWHGPGRSAQDYCGKSFRVSVRALQRPCIDRSSRTSPCAYPPSRDACLSHGIQRIDGRAARNRTALEFSSVDFSTGRYAVIPSLCRRR